MPRRPTSAPPPLIWTRPAPATRPRELDRDTVVRAGVAVADEGGAGALTMAAVARRLGPYTPMALYRYVGSKDGLIDLMLDHVTGEIDLPDRPGADWRADLEADRPGQLGDGDCGTRGTPSSCTPARRSGPNVLRRTELVLEVLTAPGRRRRRRDDVRRACSTSTSSGARSQAAEERTMRQRYGVTDPADLTGGDPGDALARHRRERYPVLAAWMADPSPATPTSSSALSLTFLLDGIGHRLVGTASARDRRRRSR